MFLRLKILAVLKDAIGNGVTINPQFLSSSLARGLRAIINALYRSMSWAYLHKILVKTFRIIET